MILHGTIVSQLLLPIELFKNLTIKISREANIERKIDGTAFVIATK